MPKGYLVANIEVTDPALFARYRQDVPAVIARYGGRYLIRGGAVDGVEQPGAFHRVTIVEFDSLEAARRFYDSEEYAPLLTMRKQATRTALALVEGAD